MARLLPEGTLRNEVGFSTFEADPRVARSPLWATWFDVPRAAATSAGVPPPGEPLPGIPGIVVEHARRGRSAAGASDAQVRGGDSARDDQSGRRGGGSRSGRLRRGQSGPAGSWSRSAQADEVVSALLETGTLADDAWQSSSRRASASGSGSASDWPSWATWTPA